MNPITDVIPDTLTGLLKAEHELRDLEAQIVKRREELARAREQHESTAPVYQLAIALHDKMCRWNHTDGCGWMYQIHKGVHDWNAHEHSAWLNKATVIMARVHKKPITCENVTEFFQNL